jgi:hypothetical protein
MTSTMTLSFRNLVDGTQVPGTTTFGAGPGVRTARR